MTAINDIDCLDATVRIRRLRTELGNLESAARHICRELSVLSIVLAQLQTRSPHMANQCDAAIGSPGEEPEPPPSAARDDALVLPLAIAPVGQPHAEFGAPEADVPAAAEQPLLQTPSETDDDPPLAELSETDSGSAPGPRREGDDADAPVATCEAPAQACEDNAGPTIDNVAGASQPFDGSPGADDWAVLEIEDIAEDIAEDMATDAGQQSDHAILDRQPQPPEMAAVATEATAAGDSAINAPPAPDLTDMADVVEQFDDAETAIIAGNNTWVAASEAGHACSETGKAEPDAARLSVATVEAHHGDAHRVDADDDASHDDAGDNTAAAAVGDADTACDADGEAQHTTADITAQRYEAAPQNGAGDDKQCGITDVRLAACEPGADELVAAALADASDDAADDEPADEVATDVTIADTTAVPAPASETADSADDDGDVVVLEATPAIAPSRSRDSTTSDAVETASRPVCTATPATIEPPQHDGAAASDNRANASTDNPTAAVTMLPAATQPSAQNRTKSHRKAALLIGIGSAAAVAAVIALNGQNVAVLDGWRELTPVREILHQLSQLKQLIA